MAQRSLSYSVGKHRSLNGPPANEREPKFHASSGPIYSSMGCVQVLSMNGEAGLTNPLGASSGVHFRR